MRRIFCAMILLCSLMLSGAGRAQPRYAALTFDDGPSGRFTGKLLDGLAQRNVKATFLLCGYRIAQYPDLTQRIAQDGHEIGSHGYSHKNMQTLGRREIAQEIMDTEALFPAGVRVRFLRPPGGCCSDAVRQVAQARQLAILNWSVDPRDWATKDAGAVEEYVLSHVKDGDVILLHDMSDSSVNAALAIIDRLTEQGYRFVTVSRLAELRQARIIPGKCYCSFPEREQS